MVEAAVAGNQRKSRQKRAKGDGLGGAGRGATVTRQENELVAFCRRMAGEKGVRFSP